MYNGASALFRVQLMLLMRLEQLLDCATKSKFQLVL
jgi:hypothetical protein